MGLLTKRTQKVENKVNLLIKGLINRNESIQKQIEETYTNIDDKLIELSCFNTLKSLEDTAIQVRLNVLESQLKEQQEREYNLQRTFTEIQREM